MRETLKKWYYNTSVGFLLIGTLVRIRNVFVPQGFLLKLRFKRLLGYSLNLKNPRSLNEKIQWLKINDRSELHTICADKFAVREHIEAKIGGKFLIPLIFSTDDPNQINPKTIPDFPVVMKSNHGSGGVHFIMDKDKTDWKKTSKKASELLKYKYDASKGEWQYGNIVPRLVVEKVIFDNNGAIPPDFKMHCFNGELAFTQVDFDRATNHKRNLYDPEWNLMSCRLAHHNGPDMEKPKNYKTMVEVAETLANDFTYVRVDLYNLEGKIYFGELTFHPGSGTERFYPETCDFDLGARLKLPFEAKGTHDK